MSRQAELVLVQPVARRPRRLSWAWLGVVPFFLFSLLFLILPTLNLVAGAFQTPDGALTLDNIARLYQPTIISAYLISIEVSIASVQFVRMSQAYFLRRFSRQASESRTGSGHSRTDCRIFPAPRRLKWDLSLGLGLSALWQLAGHRLTLFPARCAGARWRHRRCACRGRGGQPVHAAVRARSLSKMWPR